MTATDELSATTPLANARRRGGRVERSAIALTAVLALLVPVLIWWRIDLPGRALLAVGFALTSPGVPLAILLFPRNRPLWLATAPALSTAALVLLTVTQALTDTWSPSVAASVLAVATAATVVPAWSTCLPWGRPRGIRLSPTKVVRYLPWAVLAGAAALWIWAVRIVDLSQTGALGLIEVLPWQYVAALCTVLATAVAALRRRRTVVLAATAVLTVTMITTFVSFADGGAVVGTGYVHVGFADAIARSGVLLTATDARFSWPGFFTAVAALSQWAGLTDAAPLLLAYPAVIGSLYIAPLYVLGLAVTRDPRLAWTGVLLFSCGNWVQQDYFSPQSVGLLFFIVILAVIFWQTSAAQVPPVRGWPLTRLWTMVRRTPSRPTTVSQGRPVVMPAGRTVAVEVTLLVLAAALVVTHQLTPVTLIVALTLLALTGTIRSRTLWFAVGVLFSTWFAFGATDWWTGHLSVLINGFGQVEQAVSAGVTNRVRGDEAYQFMQRLRIGWSALFALAGFAGWLLSRRLFPMTATAAVVAAPGVLVAAQSYGGEIVLRVFLYALPMLAVLSAVMLGRLVRSTRRPAAVALAVLLGLGAIGLTAVRGANTAFERNPADVVATAYRIVGEAPTGSTVWPLFTDGTLRATRVGQVWSADIAGGDGTAFQRLLRAEPDYVVLTRSRQQYEHIVNGALPTWFDTVARQLVVTGRYQVIERSANVTVLARIDDTAQRRPE
ncbi:hypothetical protein [Micromonospora sp. NBC_01813]|uniref:hypothetical protein n=1 Tax=Micromonospora sp. NBC_01813 TaxID=2975988 RepID=UPI002DD891C2|nr:hypothetical protein [Micromonospora sp. NBC_01813]WSA10807.1 hypothetical protein OG958_08510 [Micromonospora sp. NBC_01813]